MKLPAYIIIVLAAVSAVIFAGFYHGMKKMNKGTVISASLAFIVASSFLPLAYLLILIMKYVIEH